ncbi:hypothetical protein CALCODRAFT_500208 [Calocera cornea HHB12733]|uniref:F-box domain-containing protein n=1 Tax=Calocera cornea HHB12733 TaxID=1353952 RepID=A0A165E641_9BASI|nr:hypothetical protein CALCODRAFT_500208 [Calocera cornea HHB12733]
MPTLLTLPPELLDTLLLHIPSPSTLLSLSLTCTQLHALAAPHLPWRRLCAYEYDLPLFTQLATNKRVGGMLRRLAVNDSGWPEPRHPLEEVAPSLLGRRLGGYRPVRPATRDPRANTGEVAALLPLVARNCTELEDVKLSVYDLNAWREFFRALGGQGRALRGVEIMEEPGPAGWELGDAEEVLELLGGRQENFAWASATIVEASELIRLITIYLTSHCPTVSTLSLYVFSPLNPIPSAQPFFTAHLPALRTLALGHVRSTEFIGTFLDTHSLLESVSIQCAGHAEIHISPDALPRVREFDVVWNNTAGLYTQVVAPLPSGKLRPLETLSITAGAFKEEGETKVFCAYLKAHSGIKGLRWEDTSMQLSPRLGAIAQACPGIRTLSILAFYLDRRLPEIAAALRNFPDLEQIIIGRGRLEAEHCAELQGACPSLTRIGPWRWCEAERGEAPAWKKEGRTEWVIRAA